MIYGLDLFSGIGGLTIALQEWVSPVAYCENDKYAQSVLLSRMQDGKLPVAPIWDDIRTLTRRHIPSVDMVYGGFPCQDISIAGTGKGLGGERSGLFFEIMRLAKEIKPGFIFLENVPAIRLRGLNVVGEELADAGYDCRWGVVSAQEMGAPHIRKRWFCLAYSESFGNRRNLRNLYKENEKKLQPKKQHKNKTGQSINASKNSAVFTNTNSNELREQSRGRRREGRKDTTKFTNNGWWKTEPDVGRVADGVQNRVDRIKCLGNAVVPCQAKEAFKRLMGL